MSGPTFAACSAVGTPAEMGLGCNSLGHVDCQEAARIIGTALDLGVAFFDTANVYAEGRSEEELGRWLPRHRDDLLICSKFGHSASVPPGTPPCSPVAVIGAVEASLRRLRRDRIDLCLIHFPDAATPPADTLGAVGDLMRAGKIAHYGVSNFAAPALEAVVVAADALGMPRPAAVQDEYNLLSRDAERGLLPMAREHGMSFIPFFPLASGLLTGGFRRDALPARSLRGRVVRDFNGRFLHDENFRKLEQLQVFCHRHGIAMTHLALQWLATREGVTTIIAGASTADQLRLNARNLAEVLPPSLIAEAETCLAGING